MALLLQLNGDLPEAFPGHERRLYVFSCRRKACRRKEGSVRALRGVRVANVEKGREIGGKGEGGEKKKGPETAQRGIGESLFGVGPTMAGPTNPFSTPPQANPFSTPSSQPTNPFSTEISKSNLPPLSTLAAKQPSPQEQQNPSLTTTFASKLKIDLPPQAGPEPPEDPWPTMSQLPKPYPSYHLDADYETLDNTKPPTHPQGALPALDPEDSTNNGKEDKIAYESPLDKPFLAFADRLSQNPLQVLRYELKGAPLLYSKTDTVGRMLFPEVRMPRCANCGGGRVFEVQLTPQAIAELEVGEEGFDGMEWGTVIVGVCGMDCAPRGSEVGQVGYLEEWAGVQWEEVGRKT
jgi:pre-rRNA-processing protein TSR4